MISPLKQSWGLPADPETRRNALYKRSPIVQAGRIRVPLLILHGARDSMASVEEVQEIKSRLVASDVPCELVIFDDEIHGLNGVRLEMYRRTFEFLEQHLTITM